MAVDGAPPRRAGRVRAERATERRRVGCGRPSTGSGRWWGVGSLVKKTRRNRLRDPALQNPEVFLSDSIMGNQNHLSNSAMRNAKDERAASFPERVSSAWSISFLSCAILSQARSRLVPSGTIWECR